MEYKDKLIKIIQNAFALVNSEEDPGLGTYLAQLLGDDGEPTTEPMDIVMVLLNNKPISQFAWDLVIELLELEIENGNPDAMNELGAMYYNGMGCEQSYEKAVFYYKMAAEKGSRLAQENLGYCYYYGRDIPVDYEKAFHYFALGAFDGQLTSLYKIGDMYAGGLYVEKNEKEAFRIYERCLQAMSDSDAELVAGPVYLRLGKAFLNGAGTEVNAETALICFQKAEIFLYNMVKNGDTKYKKSLRDAIDGQEKARALMTEELLSDNVRDATLDGAEFYCPQCGAILNEQKGFNPNKDSWTCKKCGHILFDEAVSGEKFEDTVWYCDKCGDMLSSQPGFTDKDGEWKCKKCGHVEHFTDILDVSFAPALFDEDN